MEMENETEVISDDVYIRNSYKIIKRIMDIILSVLGIMVLSPVFVIISILIKITDPKGKVFFSQKRVGKNQQSFYIYKFRSMYQNAEEDLEKLKEFNEVQGPMFKIKNDPRVTKLGSFLRAYSIDELPQLLNVLLGDMSLVGPRPPLVSEFDTYTLHDKQRLKVKPGITGLWQVSGRSSLSFAEMVELDLEYINNISLKTDLIILIKTVKVVLLKENAY